jgi:hypothetical protein
MLAADRRLTVHGTAFPSKKFEIVQTIDGPAAIAWTGNAEIGLLLADLWRKSRLVVDWPYEIQKGESWAILVVAVPRKPVVYYERLPVAQIVPAGTMRAWGSGSELALGAMAAGADARRAIEIAIEYDVASGNGIDAADVLR